MRQLDASFSSRESHPSVHFYRVYEREENIYFTVCVVKLVEFTPARRNPIDCRQKRPRHPGACSLFRFRLLLASSPLPTFSLHPCVFFSLQLTSPPRGSHSIRRSRSVVTALRLYKFYIIFMRHKVVEKPTEERRGLERESGATEGKLLRPNCPFRPLATPPVGAVVTWLGGADRTPSCSHDRVGREKRGMQTAQVGMVHRVRGGM